MRVHKVPSCSLKLDNFESNEIINVQTLKEANLQTACPLLHAQLWPYMRCLVLCPV